MISQKKLKVGDKIIDGGQVFRIFKIEKTTTEDGNDDKLLHFRPFFKIGENSDYECTIPLSSLEEAEIRMPLSLKEAKDLVKTLAKKSKNPFSDINEAKDLLKTNDPKDIVAIIRKLSEEQRKNADNFTKSKKDVLKAAFEKLDQEIAIANKTTLEKARTKIEGALQSL